MAYPTLPTASFLQPSPSNNQIGVSSRHSMSNSPGEPVTPETAKPFARQQMESPENIECKWKGCNHISTSADALYDHLCNAHVGRKSTNNLCLTCGWQDCGVKCVKRDHITSHLRVHTPLKPHPCRVCGKTFKRPQDLKKHERIHTQEHHQLHRLSKAATSDDPAFNNRLAPHSNASDRRSSATSAGSSAEPHSPMSASGTSLTSSPSSAHSAVNPPSPYDALINQNGRPGHHLHKSVSPTPSALAALHRKQHEELAAYQQREMQVLQQLAMQQEQTANYGAQVAAEHPGMNSSLKREYEDQSFQDFLADMKKRKVEPVYDADMINRLNALDTTSLPSDFPSLPSLQSNGFNQGTQGSHGNYQNDYVPNQSHQAMNPFMTPFNMPEIRNEQDLAMFNQFMMTLGRDAAKTGHQNAHLQAPAPSMAHGASFSSSSNGHSPSLSDQSQIEDLFNPEELASLGLSGMPGISPPSFGQSSAPMMPNHNTGQYGNLYPSLDKDISKRVIATLPRGSGHHTPQHGQQQRNDMFMPDAGSSNSFGFQSFSNSQSQPYGNDSHNFASFDYLAKSKPSMPMATIAPKDYYKKTYRQVVPLGTAVSARMMESSERTVVDEPDETDDEERSEVDDDDYEPTRRLSVQDLLSTSPDKNVDPDLKLPAIHRISSRDNDPSPHLPGVSSLKPGSPPRYPHVPIKRHTTDEIVGRVKRLELADLTPANSPMERRDEEKQVEAVRRRHAALIKSMIIAVNLKFREFQLKLEQGEGEDRDEDEDVDELEDDDVKHEYESEEGSRTPTPTYRRSISRGITGI